MTSSSSSALFVDFASSFVRTREFTIFIHSIAVYSGSDSNPVCVLTGAAVAERIITGHTVLVVD